MQGCSSNYINRNLIQFSEKRWITSIAPDFAMLFWLDKQWRNARIKSRTCLYNPLHFFPVLDRWANMLVFPVKSSSYILIENRVRVKSLGIAPGLANARPPGSQNLQMPHPGDWQGGQLPRSSPGGCLGAAGIDWSIMDSLIFLYCFKG